MATKYGLLTVWGQSRFVSVCVEVDSIDSAEVARQLGEDLASLLHNGVREAVLDFRRVRTFCSEAAHVLEQFCSHVAALNGKVALYGLKEELKADVHFDHVFMNEEHAQRYVRNVAAVAV